MERKATLDDCEAVYQAYMDPQNNPFMLYEMMERSEFAPIFEEMVKADNLWVSEARGAVAATYRLIRKTHRLSHVAYLGGFAVHPNFRAQGSGSQALEELTARLKREGVKRFELLVVTDNLRAINFYKRHGFEEEGVMKQFLKRQNSDEYVDELMMAKMLG